MSDTVVKDVMMAKDAVDSRRKSTVLAVRTKLV